MGLDDFLDKFNWIDRVQGVLWGLTTYLPHQRSRKGRKVGEWRVDGGTREIRVDRAHTSGGDAERILERVSVGIAGKRITDREAIFLVKERQASWAEYNLLRAGAVLGPGHKMIDPENVQWAGQYAEAVPAWAQRASATSSIAAGQDAEAPTSAKAATSGKKDPEKRKRGLLNELW